MGGPWGLPRAACSWENDSELPSLPRAGFREKPKHHTGLDPPSRDPLPCNLTPMPRPHPIPGSQGWDGTCLKCPAGGWPASGAHSAPQPECNYTLIHGPGRGPER